MKRSHVKPTEITRTLSSTVIREGEDSESSMGTFPAALASNGEATDGHILHIQGLKTPKRMPMLFGHRSEVMAPVMGSVTKPVKGKTADGKNRVLRTTNVINMEGEGQMADIRRNVARLIYDDDLNAMSLRWVPDQEGLIRRIDLPPNHYAFVDANAESRDSERYWGYFHKSATSQEGSIVAIGADPLALKGRADDMGGRPGSIFFRALAHSIESGERPDGLAQISTAFGAYQEAMTGLRSAGISEEDMATMVAADLNPADMVLYEFTDESGSSQSMMIPRGARDALLRESEAAYQAAIALHSERVEASAPSDAPTGERSSVEDQQPTPEEEDAEYGRVYPSQTATPKRDVTYYPVEPQRTQQRSIADMDPTDFFESLGSSVASQLRAMVNVAMGKIED